MIRLYIADETPPYVEGVSFPLNPDQSRYLTAVMRLKVGDEISVFNGRDGEWTARLIEAGKKAVRVQLTHAARAQRDTLGPVLAVALVKRAALEYIVEKATELGVKTIQLIISHRSNASHTNVERLVSIAKEAAEQTERLDIPQVLPPVKLENFVHAAGFDRLIFGDENSTHEGEFRVTPPMLDSLSAVSPEQRTIILIGPEGGFDEEERTMLRGLPNGLAVNLGPRILRADTAAISALTLYQAVVGDWR